ncbi:MAG: hypothetical protein WAT39_02415 [Planctomycetota bacterium]
MRPRLACILLIAVAAPAQPPIDRGVEVQLLPEVTSRLASQDLATVAWGAHLAATHRCTGAATELRRALARLAAEGPLDGERLLAVLALLDALAQTDVRMQARDLEGLVGPHTRATIWLLLAKSPTLNADFLLAAFASPAGDASPAEWLAAGNLLRRNPRALAPLLLDALQYELAIEVRDPDGTAAVGGRCWCACGPGWNAKLEVPAEFPPTALYELTQLGRTGDVLLASGPTPVFARRFVLRGQEARTRHYEPAVDRQRAMRAWLADLLGCEVASLGPFRLQRPVPWTGEQALRAEVERGRNELTAAFRELAARVRKDGLDDDDDGTPPRPVRIAIDVWDRRTVPSKSPCPC